MLSTISFLSSLDRFFVHGERLHLQPRRLLHQRSFWSQVHRRHGFVSRGSRVLSCLVFLKTLDDVPNVWCFIRHWAYNGLQLLLLDGSSPFCQMALGGCRYCFVGTGHWNVRDHPGHAVCIRHVGMAMDNKSVRFAKFDLWLVCNCLCTPR